MSYIIRSTLATGSCRGLCVDYEFIPRRRDGKQYTDHEQKFCATCERVFGKTDWTKFPGMKYCICCKKQMRVSKKCNKRRLDLRPRVA